MSHWSDMHLANKLSLIKGGWYTSEIQDDFISLCWIFINGANLLHGICESPRKLLKTTSRTLIKEHQILSSRMKWTNLLSLENNCKEEWGLYNRLTKLYSLKIDLWKKYIKLMYSKIFPKKNVFHYWIRYSLWIQY